MSGCHPQNLAYYHPDAGRSEQNSPERHRQQDADTSFPNDVGHFRLQIQPRQVHDRQLLAVIEAIVVGFSIGLAPPVHTPSEANATVVPKTGWDRHS